MHLIPVWRLPHDLPGVMQQESNRGLAAQVQAIFIEWDGRLHGVCRLCSSANEWGGLRR